MKFKKMTNFRDLFLCYVLSFVLSYLMLYFFEEINILSIWLITNAISYFIYYIVSIIYYRKITTYKNTLAKLIKCDYAITSNCELIYEIEIDGKNSEISYGLGQKEKIGKEEIVYISKNNKYLVRERDILMFSKNNLHFIPITMSLLLIIGMLIHFFGIINFDIEDGLVESFKYIFLFKFLNIFLVFFVVICKSLKDMKGKNTIKVIGRVVDVEIRECSETNEVAGVYTTRTYNMLTPKYEYTFNGKKQIYVSRSSSTSCPKIGAKKNLYVDEVGLVVKEEGEEKFLILFNALILIFYFIFVISIFKDII